MSLATKIVRNSCNGCSSHSPWKNKNRKDIVCVEIILWPFIYHMSHEPQSSDISCCAGKGADIVTQGLIWGVLSNWSIYKLFIIWFPSKCWIRGSPLFKSSLLFVWKSKLQIFYRLSIGRWHTQINNVIAYMWFLTYPCFNLCYEIK